MDVKPITEIIKIYSENFDYNKTETAVILAAGHGKRIKSNRSKMLHKIWGKPTVERVYNACLKGLNKANIIIVTGIKAEEVIKTLNQRESVSYVYQAEQNGTGHAVQVAIEGIDFTKYDGTIFIFPGDVGLIDSGTISFFRDQFYKSKTDMMVLTGMYEGEIENNYYGRIIREKSNGDESKTNGNDVLEIIEYKDILDLGDDEYHIISYRNKKYKYSKKELLEIREYNSGVYAFKAKAAADQIKKIQNNNVQKEIYLTDLIALFNKSNYKVSAVYPKEEYVVMGFNNKSVLKEMEIIARQNAYNKVKDIITIEDPSDFFIDEDIIEYLVEMDEAGSILDIKIGKGVYLGKDVKLNYGVILGRNVFVTGNVHFGKNVKVDCNSTITCCTGEKITLGEDVIIGKNNIVKGNVAIGDKTNIETLAVIKGDDKYQTIIGKNVFVRGNSHINGSIIEDNIIIEHSYIIKKKISKPENFKDDFLSVRFFIPHTEWKDAVMNLKKDLE